MSEEQLKVLYFDWMVELIATDDHSVDDIYDHYKTLINVLYTTEFDYVMEMDGNRYEDGIELRYRFGYENDYPDSMIATYLDNLPCSVLEMMVALAYRCEESIRFEPGQGVHVGRLFWEMIDNLGLSGMDNRHFDLGKYNLVMETFMNRWYASDGHGNLFAFDEDFLKHNTCKPLRHTEIWYQMHLYLDYIAIR